MEHHWNADDYNSAPDDFHFPTPRPPSAPTMSAVDISQQRYTLTDEQYEYDYSDLYTELPPRDEDSIAPEQHDYGDESRTMPENMRLSELDLAVARLQQRIFADSNPADANSETDTLIHPHRANTIISRTSKDTTSSQGTAVENASFVGAWNKTNYSKLGDDEKDVGPPEDEDPQAKSESMFASWKRVAIKAVNSFTEPNGVPKTTEPVKAYSQTTSSTSHFAPVSPPRAATTPAVSRSTPEPRAFDYDPENYALDTTPNAYYHRASYVPPRSQSPTPQKEAKETKTPVVIPARPVLVPRENKRIRVYPTGDKPLEKVASPEQSPLIDSTTMHFGLPPKKQQRRNRTKKLVPLTHGHFVLDLDVPSKLVLAEKGEAGEESLTCRYTGVTCDPDDFEPKKYLLRQNISGRETELAIVITMYNEDEVLLCRTLYGVMRNIKELCARKASRTWGPDAWKKVVVIIVADGRKSVNPRVLDCLAALGVYQPGPHMKNVIFNEPVTAHLFEYTTTMAIDPALHFQLMTPTQIIFCLKEKNTKKINSHRWFFNAFGALLRPNICVLIDVGTRPAAKSLYRLWKTFDLNSNVGGACGEIAAFKGRHWSALLNPLVAAQNFEYKMSNILDKPLESMLGYITVLPGAFSAYRYIALQNDKRGHGPLASYFKGEVAGIGKEHGLFASNMYLAEDRILCFELVAKRSHDWVLRYVKGAVGETDVPNALPEFISQRRRWLNGSLFSSIYALAHVNQLLYSDHTFSRKAVLLLESLYNLINLVFSWFGLGNYYIFFVILTSSMEAPSFGLKGVKYFNAVIQYLFAGCIAACFLFSIGNKPKASPWKYRGVAIFFALTSAYMIGCSVTCAIHIVNEGTSSQFASMIVSLLATVGLWAAASVLAFDPAHLITSALPYLLLSPSYIIILNTYAFSNIDDISWGTKQQGIVDNDLGTVSAFQRRKDAVEVEIESEPHDLDTQYLEALENLRTRKPIGRPPVDSQAEKVQQNKDYYANIRTNVLLAWVLSNALIVVGILGGSNASATFTEAPDGSRTRQYMTFILVFVAMTSAIRFLGSTMFLIMRIFTG